MRKGRWFWLERVFLLLALGQWGAKGARRG